MSYADAIADFIGAMELEGVKPVEPIAQRLASGELIRFRCDGDGKGRQNGWAKLYLDERPAGAFGNYRLGISRKWKVESYQAMTPEERARLTREWADAKQRREEERRASEYEASLDAQDMWSQAALARPDHAYLVKKRLDPSPLRQFGDRLLIPMYDPDGKLWNLQRIASDGSKRFLRGGRTESLFCIIAPERLRDTVCIGEGYATMAAVQRASGHMCVVAFSAKNLLPVARIWSDHRPDLSFIICADNDAHLERNIGVEAAHAAAIEIGARLAIPPTLGEAA